MKNNNPPAMGPNGKRKKMSFSSLKRLLKMLYGYYPVLLPVIIACVIFSAITASVPAIFQQQVLQSIQKWITSGDWNSAKQEILPKIIFLGSLYCVSLICVIVQSQLIAIITQGFLGKMRKSMFNGMQNLPIKYFDTHNHGDIMSFYTNDIDAIRQLISQSIPAILQASIVVVSVFCIMMWYSIWMTLVVIFGVVVLFFVTKKVGGGSAKFFIRQQKSIAKTEGFVQEMMSGQKGVKVFCHEAEACEEFEKINNQLYEDSNRAHAYANCLGPINQNIGNILYVLIATVGGLFLLSKTPNFSISGMAFQISIVIPFLNMTKQFTGNVNQVSQQINSIVMGLAGAERIFNLMDEANETDEGYVTLVNAKIDKEGN